MNTLTICTLVTDAKFYAVQVILDSLQQQTLPRQNIRVLFVTDDRSPRVLECLTQWTHSPAAAGYLAVQVACESVTASSSPLQSQPLENIWRIAQLRQRGLREYVQGPPDFGLVWWDADQDWSANFLAAVLGCGANVATGVYVARASNQLCHVYQDAEERIHSLQAESLGEIRSNLYNGFGGFFAHRFLWEAFAREGGWKTFLPKYGPPFWGGCEDFWCCHRLGIPAKLLSGVTCRHFEADGRFQETPFFTYEDTSMNDDKSNAEHGANEEHGHEEIWTSQWDVADADARITLTHRLMDTIDPVGLLPLALSAENEYNRIEGTLLFSALARDYPERFGELMRLAVIGLQDSNLHVRRNCFQFLASRPEDADMAWLSVREEKLSALPGGPWETDALDRAAFLVSREKPRCSTCLLCAISPGYEPLLGSLCESLRLHGNCPDIRVVAVLVNADDACREMAVRCGIETIDAVTICGLNTSLKSLLYSAVQLVDADYYFVMDADVLIVGDIMPMVEMIRSGPEDHVTMVPASDEHGFSPKLQRIYGLDQNDLTFLQGHCQWDPEKMLIVNAGVLGGSKQAWAKLRDALLEHRSRYALWMDEAETSVRDEFLVVQTLAQSDTLTLGPSAYNSLIADGAWLESAAGALPRVYDKQGPVSIVHFAGPLARRELPRFQQVFCVPHSASVMAASVVGTLTGPLPELTIPKIIHHIWLGGCELPSEYRENIRVWKVHHPTWEFKIWLDADVAALNLTNRRIFEAMDNNGWRSDVLRYEIMLQFGGVYVDTDIKCLKNIEPLLAHSDVVLGALPLGDGEVTQIVENAFLAARPWHPFFQEVIDSMAHKFDEYASTSRRATLFDVLHITGPVHLSDAVRQYRQQPKNYRRDITIVPQRFVYPASYWEVRSNRLQAMDLTEAYMLHKWDGSWAQEFLEPSV